MCATNARCLIQRRQTGKLAIKEKLEIIQMARENSTANVAWLLEGDAATIDSVRLAIRLT
jgi:hypothetical protein